MEPTQFFRQKKWLFFVGIKALIVKNEKLLVLSSGSSELSSTKRKRAFWDLPGGKVEWGEDIQETLQREVQEELGIRRGSLQAIEIFEASVSKIRTSHAVHVPLILITFICRLQGRQKFKLSDEHASYKWVGAGTAQKLLSTKFNKTFIKKLGSLRTKS
ncbi:MAG: NUDIX hydrolase [Candidatus Micrarchaeota archaeon]|nr:NUDIX hydrolase [Candidatus Micrarchaeota archaeon]